MSINNGGEVIGMTYHDERQFLSRYNRFILTHHHTKRFYHLFDAMLRVNPELREMVVFVRKNVSENWWKNIRGRVINDLMVRYLYYSLHPQQYAFKGYLVLYANYFYIQQYLQRIVRVLIENYNYESKFYNFAIKTESLLRLSNLWGDEMIPFAKDKLVSDYNRLMSRLAKSGKSIADNDNR